MNLLLKKHYGSLILLECWTLNIPCALGILSFTVVAACLSVMVSSSDSTHFPPPLLQCAAVSDGQCGGNVFASQEWWEAEMKRIGLENYTTLAINPFVKPSKKIMCRVELERFYL